MYLTPVLIGNQEMILDFDTGSSDLWVRSPYFSSYIPMTNHLCAGLVGLS